MRATAIVHRWSSRSGSGCEAMRVPGFARKFWTMTSCTCPCSSPSARRASNASIRSSRVSPIPIRIPLVKGIRSSPARRIVSRRRAGILSGEAQCGPPRSPSRSAVVSSMIPIEAETGRRSSSSSRVMTPGFRCGSRPGLLEDEPRAALEVLDRRLAAERAQLLARDLVAELGLVPEREERLATARRGAGTSDREHLVLGHERPLSAPRRPRERAVAADVPAQRRQRDEDLRRVRDERPAPQSPRLGEELVEWRGEEFGRSCSRSPRAYVDDAGAHSSHARKRAKEDEMRFLFLIHGDDEAEAALTPDERRAIVGEHIAYAAMLRERGVLRARRGARRTRVGSSRPPRRRSRSSPTGRSQRRRRRSEASTWSSARAARRRSSSPDRVPPSPGAAVEVLTIADVGAGGT